MPATPENSTDAAYQLLRGVFDSLSDGIVVRDASGRILDFNPAALQILGLSAEQLLGHHSTDPRLSTVDEDGRPFPGDCHPSMEALRTGRPVRGVVMGVHKLDGSLAWIRINAQPLLDADHVLTGVVTSFADVTERKDSERALDRERRLNRQIIETAPIGLSFYDENGDCLTANPAMARDIGATLPEVLAQNYHGIESWKRIGLAAVARRALESDQIVAMEAPVVTSFGKHAWLALTCRAVEFEGHRGLMLVTQDLTEARAAAHSLEQSEIKYRTLVEQAHDGIFIFRQDGFYTEVNQAATRMVGYTRDELLAMKLDDLVDATDPEQQPFQLDRLLRGEQVLVERRLRRKDGSILMAEISSSMMPDGNFLGIVRDIGQRKEAEEALRAKAVAERSNRAKSEFLSRMSHELRTPLNAILGFAEVMRTDDQHALDATQQSHLQHIRRSGEHLLSLIDELLDLSSIEAGAIKLQLEDVDLCQVAQEAVHDSRMLAQRNGVTLSLQVPGSVRVRADLKRLRQVVANLLSNAIKYNRSGGQVVLTVTATGDRARLSVADNGPGMTENQQQGLFQPFNRLGRDASPVKGTGIGLVITRNLVKLMDGELGVRCESGVGSEFTVDLARGVAAIADPNPAAISTPTDATRRSDVSGRVLYVEDDEVNRMLMTAYLGLRPGVELTLAVNGEAGLQAAATGRYDVVLTDMTLPDMSGLEFLKALRERPGMRKMPCVAISANAMPDDIAVARDAGMDDYLAKPLSAAQLLACLDALLSTPAASQDTGQAR